MTFGVSECISSARGLEFRAKYCQNRWFCNIFENTIAVAAKRWSLGPPFMVPWWGHSLRHENVMKELLNGYRHMPPTPIKNENMQKYFDQKQSKHQS